MDLWSAISVGLKEIWANKFRSLLTMLGIILGVASLVSMSALVAGMEKGAREALIAIGGLKKVRLEPQDVPVDQRHLKDQAVGITMKDVEALQHNAHSIEILSPEMRQYGAVVGANGKTFSPFIVAGVWPVALEMGEHEIEHGRMFNEMDDDMARSVCVIGTETRNELFGSPEEAGREIIPIGEIITINNQAFTIIGMFKHYESEQDRKKRELENSKPKEARSGPTRSKGWRGGGQGNFVFWLKNATVFMPMNTMWIKFRSGSTSSSSSWGRSSSITYDAGDPRLSTLEVRLKDVENMDAALQQIRNILMITHKGIEDFAFRTQEEWSENINAFIKNARLSGGIIAAISLLVGGIGIMNIMLASISERVREVGIRKSVGATTLDIFVQILVESVVLAVLGGLVGLEVSFLLVKVLASISPTDNAPIITMGAMALAFGSSVGIGVLAGLFPAFKASRLSPLVALRYD